jgi:hypothetical protein
MSGEERSDTEVSLLHERIILAAKYTDLTLREPEVLASAMVRLLRYRPALFLSVIRRGVRMPIVTTTY